MEQDWCYNAYAARIIRITWLKMLVVGLLKKSVFTFVHSEQIIMYTRQQASQLRQAFWTAFGKYMSPVPSADGSKTNWINYNTGVKNIYFRMHADANNVTLQIEITHPDLAMQKACFEQFLTVKNMLHNQLGEEWDWQLHSQDEVGKIISTIGTSISGSSIFEQEDWPTIISFFKPRLIVLDDFWYNVRDVFE